MYLYASSSTRAPTCITSTVVRTAVIAINAISVTAIAMIFLLIESRIIDRTSCSHAAGKVPRRTQLDLANVHSLAGHEISEDNFGRTHQTMESRCGAIANVRFGSKTEEFRFALDVRLGLGSRARQASHSGPVRAKPESRRAKKEPPKGSSYIQF